MSSVSNTWLLTGPPGIGKSTALSKILYRIRTDGRIIGGCITKERRKRGRRIGFDIEDLLTGEKAELASSESLIGPAVGKYRVNLSNLANLGAGALSKAKERAEVIVIDEIGPIELMSPEFRRAVTACLESGKPLLAVVHERMKDPIIDTAKEKAGQNFFQLDYDNRDSLPDEIAGKITKSLPEI